jgi:hypothetical protein
MPTSWSENINETGHLRRQTPESGGHMDRSLNIVNPHKRLASRAVASGWTVQEVITGSVTPIPVQP